MPERKNPAALPARGSRVCLSAGVETRTSDAAALGGACDPFGEGRGGRNSTLGGVGTDALISAAPNVAILAGGGRAVQGSSGPKSARPVSLAGFHPPAAGSAARCAPRGGSCGKLLLTSEHYPP